MVWFPMAKNAFALWKLISDFMKALFIVGGILCIMAAVGMFYVGSNSGHLSELKDFFWVPLPLGVILLILGFRKSPQ